MGRYAIEPDNATKSAKAKVGEQLSLIQEDDIVQRSPLSFQTSVYSRDGRPAPRGTLPAGRGGFPTPTRPVKMIKTAGKLRGKIKAYI